jgi:hypothetical protein
MAYKSLLTYGSKVSSVEQLYYAPVATLPSLPNIPLASIYFLLATNDPWTDDNNPPAPTQDQQSVKLFLNKVFVAKYIHPNDISPVIQRRDWKANTAYDYYDDTADMFAVDTTGYLVKNFYVKNRYDQVFKCLWNGGTAAANGNIIAAQSIYEPFFEPGTYNTNNIYQNNDGYKWKYMFTVDSAAKIKFMDSYWIPVPVGQNTPNPLYNLNTGKPLTAGIGDIEVVNVVNGGSGYDTTISSVNIFINGDGSFGTNPATATAVVANGAIQDIVVTNPGSNYTYSSISVLSGAGANAVAIAPVSPIGGHGFDPASELGCSRVMLTSEFNGAENGYIPTDINYHQVGIVINPTTYSLGGIPANGEIYKTTTDLVVAPGFGTFAKDEQIYQQVTQNGSTYYSFFGTVLSFDQSNNVVKVINTVGTSALAPNSPVYGYTSATSRTLLSYTTPDFITLSGYIAFLENRSGIQRSVDGKEQFKFVLGY